jgi:hypothetical protein
MNLLSILMYIVSLGTSDVEQRKKFLELKFCETGGGVCLVFNYCKKFQTICFILSPLTIHFFLRNQPFALV